ncbi:hypothetical protein ABZ864_45110 [Streptomyces sp. NPDC047082]|uniref:hypothetical protein n=1 Tax=Streptomyces sp. NPDC047082 TaxID=3155259 RepID=UPI0033F7E8C9
MTRHPEPNPNDQAARQWLAQHQHALTHALDDLLDIEAGLREILLHSHHDTATDNLDTVLDTEAGLAAILPTTPQTPPAGPHDTPHHHTDTTAAEEILRTLSPADRMTLRNHPDVEKASQALASARDLDRDLARVRARDLARALARDLARALAGDLDLALARALHRDRDLARDLDRARDLHRTLALDLDLDRDLDRARDLYRALHRALTRARVLAGDRDLALDLDRALARTLDLDRALDLALYRTLDRDHAHVIIVEVLTAEVGRAIGLALRREPPALDKDSLHTLLDDFTTADLSNADLTGADLGGVHWSEHTTQWPLDIDVEDLKTHSDETPPGSGTWIVRFGTATVRDLAER